MVGLPLALPTAQDTTVGGIRYVWLIPRRWVRRWYYEQTQAGSYGSVVGAEYGRKLWYILTRMPIDGRLTYREAAKTGSAFTYNTTLSVTVQRASLERRDWLEALSQSSDVALLVQLIDGTILLMGEERGCRISVELDSGTRGQGTKLTITANHTTRAPLRTVPYDVAADWVTPDYCGGTISASCALTLDDFCAPTFTEVCPPAGAGGQGLAIQLVPGPPGPPGNNGADGAPGANALDQFPSYTIFLNTNFT